MGIHQGQYPAGWVSTRKDRLYYASNYFDKLYEFAGELIKQAKASSARLTPGSGQEYRGTLTEPGKNSPDRDNSIEQNLDLFTRMKAGEFDDGAYTLSAKIDMASPNINMRDPRPVSHQASASSPDWRQVVHLSDV